MGELSGKQEVLLEDLKSPKRPASEARLETRSAYIIMAAKRAVADMSRNVPPLNSRYSENLAQGDFSFLICSNSGLPTLRDRIDVDRPRRFN